MSQNYVDAELYLNADYRKMWNYQSDCHRAIIQAKRAGISTHEMHKLISCTHPHVFTLGKSGSEDHLMADAHDREANQWQYYKINRGGDITYHGPGQWVVYPIFDLEHFQKDVHLYVRNLEEVIIRCLNDWGIVGTRIPGYTGVWVENDRWEKICAIGVHLSRWVSMHGLAFNVNTDLDMFDQIIPCGIEDQDKSVCSMQSILNQEVNFFEVRHCLMKHFQTLFRFNYK